MGTSNSFGGQNNNTPLVPNWLEPEAPELPAADSQLPGKQRDDDSTKQPEITPPEPQTPNLYRFRTARTNMTNFASSGDSAKLGRAISNFVSTSSGGARQAAKKMGSSRKSGARLLSFLSEAINLGVTGALKTLHLDKLAGRTIEEIFSGMIDYVCQDGGTIDQGVARDAFIEMIADLAESGITDLDTLNRNQVQTVFELFVTHTIVNRLYNDIGTKAIQIPGDIDMAIQIQDQLCDFVRRGVADTLSNIFSTLQSLTIDKIQGFVDQVYQDAFEILQSLGEMEAAR